ncbi:HNH endonuclease [Nonomuraea sp. H19]|uniref:HNH endonuclease n=1 Tax=Nonomuraea sp. H19 TaxID=3452206 RepID=UPI003F8AD6D5
MNLCGSTERVEAHHIPALKDLNPKGRKHPPDWVTRMASRCRKTSSSAASGPAGEQPRHSRGY